MPIDTGGGFFSRLGQQMPGMINATAQQYGDPRLKNTNQQVGSAYKGFQGRRPPEGRMQPPGRPNMGRPTPMDGGGMMPPPAGPIDTGGGIMPPDNGGGFMGPSMPRIIGPGGPMGPGGPPMNGGGFRFPPNSNTGITGGMFPGGMRPQPAPMDGGGLWQMYNQLSQDQGVPRRPQMFY